MMGQFNPGQRQTPMPAQARPRFGQNNPGQGGPSWRERMQGERPQWNKFAAGRKVYGGGRHAPNFGRSAHREGYGRRDGEMRARRQAFLDRMKGFS